jgi:hypothetical protein
MQYLILCKQKQQFGNANNWKDGEEILINLKRDHRDVRLRKVYILVFQDKGNLTRNAYLNSLNTIKKVIGK